MYVRELFSSQLQKWKSRERKIDWGFNEMLIKTLINEEIPPTLLFSPPSYITFHLPFLPVLIDFSIFSPTKAMLAKKMPDFVLILSPPAFRL